MDPDILDLRFAFLAPVMGAGEEDDEEEEDEDDEEEDEPEEQEGAPARKSRKTEPGDRDPRVRAANEEAKRHRLQNKTLRRELRELKTKMEEAEEKEKPELERLKNKVASLVKVESERDELKIQNAVLKAAIKYKVSGDVDFLEYKLRKMGLLKLDEEGDLPDEFEDKVKSLAQEMSSASGDGSRDGDRDDNGEKPTPPTSPKLSSGKKKGNAKDSDLSALARRYPALMQKSGSVGS